MASVTACSIVIASEARGCARAPAAANVMHTAARNRPVVRVINPHCVRAYTRTGPPTGRQSIELFGLCECYERTGGERERWVATVAETAVTPSNCGAGCSGSVTQRFGCDWTAGLSG